MPAPGATHGAGLRPGLTRAPGPARKVCPVVLRRAAVLAFRHPRAGRQLVKGTPEAGELPAGTAARELAEESGLHLAPRLHLVRARVGAPGIVWDFVLMDRGSGPDVWTHHYADDGGHAFRFFWHPLTARPGRGWHPVHVHALLRLTRLLRARRWCPV